MQFLNENEQEQSGIGMDEERERRVLHADNLEQLALLFGSLDENIETVAQRTVVGRSASAAAISRRCA